MMGWSLGRRGAICAAFGWFGAVAGCERLGNEKTGEFWCLTTPATGRLRGSSLIRRTSWVEGTLIGSFSLMIATDSIFLTYRNTCMV